MSDYPVITGVLQFKPRSGFKLVDENGDHWTLDIDWNVQGHVGRLVTVRGYRYGFFRIDVTELVEAD